MCELLYISRVVGVRAAVICKLKKGYSWCCNIEGRGISSFARIASSIGVKDWAIVDISLKRAPIATFGNINEKNVETVISERYDGIGKTSGGGWKPRRLGP